MMERTIKTKDQLEIDKTVCVYEQAIYVKDMEGQLKEPKSSLHTSWWWVLFMFCLWVYVSLA